MIQIYFYIFKNLILVGYETNLESGVEFERSYRQEVALEIINI